MKKVIVTLSIIVIYFVIYFLQVNFFSWFTIAGVKPNLFILLVLFIGIFMGGKNGAILGSIIGLYTDFLFSQTIGISCILMGLMGWSGDYIEKKFSKESKLTIVLMGSIVTIIYEILSYIYKMLKLSASLSILSFLQILVIEIIYNAFIVIIFYPLIHKFGIYTEDVMKNKKMLPKYF